MDIVSIIMPTYNSEKYVKYAIESVLSQTYKEWELIIIDDASTDNTLTVLKKYSELYKKIKIISLKTNSGAGNARNQGIKVAKGNIIAFLDSDDIWYPKKLEKQLKFMKDNSIYFCCTYYDKINEIGKPLSINIKAKPKLNYLDILKNSAGNSTVMYDCRSLGKFYTENIRCRNDYVLWLKIVKKSRYLYCFNDVLSSHRVRPNSISSKKIRLIKFHWIVYREIEKLSLMFSFYLIIHWCIRGWLLFVRQRFFNT